MKNRTCTRGALNPSTYSFGYALLLLGLLGNACGSPSSRRGDDDQEGGAGGQGGGTADTKKTGGSGGKPATTLPVPPPTTNKTDAGVSNMPPVVNQPKMDAGVVVVTPPVFVECPMRFNFETDVQGAMATHATISRETTSNGCGKGSLKLDVDLPAGKLNHATIRLPAGPQSVELMGKLVSCLYNRQAGVPTDVRIWLQAFSDTEKWIEAWELFPGQWSAVRKKMVDKPMVTKELVLWLSESDGKAWKGTVFLDECGWE